MSQPTSSRDLVGRVLQGEMRAAARLMRLIDDRAGNYLEHLKALHPHTGKAYVLGITGTPGAGKSTLVDKLIECHRKRGAKVGVLAVDPTSPYSGGAILGDRIRMQRHFLDEQVFIRSLATRGHLGGLSRSAGDVIRVMDAWGCDVIILETVGVGQDELEVARLAHTTVVVMAPGGGDDIQAIKAGILEVADVFAVNKSDRDGADATVRDLEGMLALTDTLARAGAKHSGHSAAMMRMVNSASAQDGQGWTPEVIKTVAVKNDGLEPLVDACERHRNYLFDTDAGERRRQQRRVDELDNIFRDLLLTQVQTRLGDAWADVAEEVGGRNADPYQSAQDLVARALGGEPPA